jgi:hypothetical protein
MSSNTDGNQTPTNDTPNTTNTTNTPNDTTNTTTNTNANANANATTNTNANTNNGDNGNSGNNNSSNTSNPNPSNPITNNDDFKTLTLDETINIPGAVITNQQGTTVGGSGKTQTTFDTIDDINNAVDLTENLVEIVRVGYDNSSVTGQLVSQISSYASKIKCSEFQGKGSVDDYNALFAAAANIANESKQMTLDVNVAGFEEFGQAADELSALFTSFTKRLQRVSIIDDTVFLQSVLAALIKIDNLSNVFGRFKETILLTSTVNIPQSSHNVSTILTGVMSEVSCAMGYINNFVTPDASLPAGQLSATDKNIINRAVHTIENWSILCDQGVSIALDSNPDIQLIKSVNSNLKTKSNVLKSATNSLKAKFILFQ